MPREKLGINDLMIPLILFVIITIMPTIFMFTIRDNVTPTLYLYIIMGSVLGVFSFIGFFACLAELEGKQLKIDIVEKEKEEMRNERINQN